MMNNECCCKTCYKRLHCGGCIWYSDMCDKDRSECIHKRMHDLLGDDKVVGDLDDKRKSK